ncbi:hypothetical protein [Natrinema sp. HArc-T2]|uniref:hypothetical protein n=1 Tax=Natrinema sp. HArc-T2 TaxID=3242701 RepID=UPI00359EE67D
MKRTTLIAAVFAVLIMATGFAVAAPGNAPVDVDTGADSTDDHAESEPQHATDHDDRRENAATERNGNGAAADEHNGNGAADERNGQGPNVDLPAQVPDHVSTIHDRISSFLSGDLETSLGDAISEVTPDDENADESDEAGDASEDETDDEQTDDEQTADEQTNDKQTDDEQTESDDTQSDA